MNRNNKSIFMHFILAFALITASISPACKFISGQQNGFIEICTSFGTKFVPVPENTNSAQPENKNKSSEQCLFCFFAQTHKVITNKNLNLNLALSEIKIINIIFVDKILHSQQTISFEARAPPISPDFS